MFDLDHQRPAAHPVSDNCTSGSASTSASSLRAPTRGMRRNRPSTGETNIKPAETNSATSTPAASVQPDPSPSFPKAMPPDIAAWNAASERPATQRAARKLHADIEQRHRQHPGCARHHQRGGGDDRLVAYRDRGDRTAHRQRAGAHRRFAGHALANFRDVERADHRAHAEGAEHDAVGLRAAIQEIARHQRHQRRDRAAEDASDQRARQHDADRGCSWKCSARRRQWRG